MSRFLALQELLHPNGALRAVLDGASLGSPALAPWGLPCAVLARTAVKLLGRKPAAEIDAQSCWAIAAWVRGAASQARPALDNVAEQISHKKVTSL